MTFWGTVSDNIGSVRKIVIAVTLGCGLFILCPHSDGGNLLDAIISNLESRSSTFPRTDVAVCR